MFNLNRLGFIATSALSAVSVSCFLDKNAKEKYAFAEAIINDSKQRKSLPSYVYSCGMSPGIIYFERGNIAVGQTKSLKLPYLLIPEIQKKIVQSGIVVLNDSKKINKNLLQEIYEGERDPEVERGFLIEIETSNKQEKILYYFGNYYRMQSFQKSVDYLNTQNLSEQSEEQLLETIKKAHSLMFSHLAKKDQPSVRTRVMYVFPLNHSREALDDSCLVTPPPEKIDTLMKAFASDLKRKYEQIKKEKNPDYISFASWAHSQLSYIHPFTNGNGKMSRILMNKILQDGGYTPIVFPSDDEYTTAVMKGYKDLNSWISFVSGCIKTQKDWEKIG